MHTCAQPHTCNRLVTAALSATARMLQTTEANATHSGTAPPKDSNVTELAKAGQDEGEMPTAHRQIEVDCEEGAGPASQWSGR